MSSVGFNRDDLRAWIRWTRGPLDRQIKHMLNYHLSEIILAVDRDNYNGRYLMSLRSITIARFKSSGWSIDTPLPLKTRGIISSFHRWSDASDLIVMIRGGYISSQPLIKASLHRMVTHQFRPFKYRSSRRKKAPAIIRQIRCV